MQLKTDLSPGEIREASRLLRPKNFWLNFLLASWYATALLIVAIAVLVNNTLIEHEPPKWNAIAICLVLAAIRYSISWSRWNARQVKAAGALKPGVGTRSLESTGIQTTLATGATSFVPWSSYNKWVEGETVFVVTGSAGPVILPVDMGNRDSLRGLLQSRIA
jgi:hypothetical protein